MVRWNLNEQRRYPSGSPLWSTFWGEAGWGSSETVTWLVRCHRGMEITNGLPDFVGELLKDPWCLSGWFCVFFSHETSKSENSLWCFQFRRLSEWVPYQPLPESEISLPSMPGVLLLHFMVLSLGIPTQFRDKQIAPGYDSRLRHWPGFCLPASECWMITVVSLRYPLNQGST